MAPTTDRESNFAPTQPLAGWTVFTLRPAGEARALLAGLRQQGATAFNLPLMRLHARSAHAVEAALLEAWEAQRWLFSSPAAVRHLEIVSHALARDVFAPDGPLRQCARRGGVYAPGPGTAHALNERGIDPVRIPATRFDSEGVLDLPDLAAPLSGMIAIVGADGGRGLLEDVLTQRGARTALVHVYRRSRTALPATLQRRLEQTQRPMLITSSASMLQRLPEAMPGALLDRLVASAPIVLSSARLSDTAAALGFRHRFIAESASPDALVAASRLAADAFVQGLPRAIRLA